MKKCRFCAEEIQDEAILCWYCGRDQDPASTVTGSTSAASKLDDSLGLILLIIPIAVALLAWFWIGNMEPFEGPSSKLGLLAVLMVLSTATIAGVEASKLGMGSDADLTSKGNRRTTPDVWAVAIIVVWIIFYPAYLFNRARYGVRSLGIPGIVVTVLVLVSLVAVHATITEQFDDIFNNFP